MKRIDPSTEDAFRFGLHDLVYDDDDVKTAMAQRLAQQGKICY